MYSFSWLPSWRILPSKRIGQYPPLRDQIVATCSFRYGCLADVVGLRRFPAPLPARCWVDTVAGGVQLRRRAVKGTLLMEQGSVIEVQRETQLTVRQSDQGPGGQRLDLAVTDCRCRPLGTSRHLEGNRSKQTSTRSQTVLLTKSTGQRRAARLASLTELVEKGCCPCSESSLLRTALKKRLGSERPCSVISSYGRSCEIFSLGQSFQIQSCHGHTALYQHKRLDAQQRAHLLPAAPAVGASTTDSLPSILFLLSISHRSSSTDLGLSAG